MLSSSSSIIAFDVGDRRIGVASANAVARIARPLTTVDVVQAGDAMAVLKGLVAAERAAAVVVGLPRGLDGQHTAQTRKVEAFVQALKQFTEVPIYWQDEAVTSHQAEQELARQGKTYNKGEVDALAATYILEDFLREHPEVKA